MRTLLAVTLLLSLVACGGPREAGPAADERGKVAYWKVSTASVSDENCTDMPQWKENLKAPVFEENTFLMFKVAADGKTATMQDCKTTLASSCVDAAQAIVLAIDGHTLTFAAPAEVSDIKTSTGQVLAGCKASRQQTWTLEDRGETLPVEVDLAFDLVGDPVVCNDVENEVKAESPNQKGVKGCHLIIHIDTTFSHVD